MNFKSLFITIAVAFVVVWITDFLIHGVLLASTYAETKELWRPEVEMMSKMPLMLLGQLLSATAFTVLFANWVAAKRSLSSTLLFSVSLALFFGAGQIMMYAVQPYPGLLIVKWILAALVQIVLLGLVVHKLYELPPNTSA